MEFSSEYRKTKCRRKCSVRDCDSKMTSHQNVSFHKLPKSGIEIQRVNLFGFNETTDKRAEWLRILGIKEVNQELVICSKHFSADDYCFPDADTQHRVLKKNAVPRYVMKPQTATQIETSRKKRKERLAQRNSRKENIKSKPAKRRAMKRLNKNKKINEESTSHKADGNINIEAAVNVSEDNAMDLKSSEINPQQALIVEEAEEAALNVSEKGAVDLNLSEINPHEAEPESHDEDCELLQRESDVIFDDSEMAESSDKVACDSKHSDIPVQKKNNVCEDKSVQVYTDNFIVTFSSFIQSEKELISLCNIKSFEILNELTKIMDDTYPPQRKRSLSTRDSILLTTAKLKLDIPFVALAVFFKSVTDVTIRNIFYDTVKKLASILQSVIRRVPKEEILRNMPKCFEKYKATTSVLDCTEIKIQTPKCLKCQIKFYSNYKSHLTVKFMTEVTPAGLITYVSESFGGRASDKAIFNHSGILQHLESTRDAVMVDQGFLIDDECMERRVKLIRPPFLKNRQQLSKEEAIENKDIACARVHIERMNQRIKQFQILNHNFPWHMIDYVDDIFVICCGLANLDTPILADDKF